jgi:hypothetical protein
MFTTPSKPKIAGQLEASHSFTTTEALLSLLLPFQQLLVRKIIGAAAGCGCHNRG